MSGDVSSSGRRKVRFVVSMLRATMLCAVASRAAAFGVSARASTVSSVRRMSAPAMGSFYDFKANKLDGSAASMDAFKGKPVLILNVASL